MITVRRLGPALNRLLSGSASGITLEMHHRSGRVRRSRRTADDGSLAIVKARAGDEITFRWWRRGPTEALRVVERTLVASGDDGACWEVEFDDGSIVEVSRSAFGYFGTRVGAALGGGDTVLKLASAYTDDEPPADNTLDAGLSLLEPVTVTELRGLEALLEQLWQFVGSGELDAVHEHQLRSMVEFIEESRRAAEPGETPRWQLVGPVREALRRIWPEGRNLSGWMKVVETLQNIGWNELAKLLGG